MMVGKIFSPLNQLLPFSVLDDHYYEDNTDNYDQSTIDVYNNDVLFINQWMKDEESLMNLPFDNKMILAAVMLISLLIGSFFKSITYAYFLSTSKENRGWMHRPINILLLTSSLIHHATHIWMWSWYVISFLTIAPLSDIFGFHGCQVIQIVAGFGMCYLTVGGFGITVYRILLIKYEYWVKNVIGQKALLGIILSLSFVICWIIVFLYGLEGNLSRPTLNTTLNYCQGVSMLYAQILIEYEQSRGETKDTTTYIQAIAVGLCIVFQTLELSSYVYFFYLRYKHDNGNVAKLLTLAATRDRNLKNIQTFIGQFYGFLVEYAYLFFWFVVIILADEQSNSVKSYANVVKFMDFGILSAVEYFTSPILREFMR